MEAEKVQNEDKAEGAEAQRHRIQYDKFSRLHHIAIEVLFVLHEDDHAQSNLNSQSKNDKHEHSHERYVVEPADAIGHPPTMVVEVTAAPVTLCAVLAELYHARFAHIAVEVGL